MRQSEFNPLIAITSANNINYTIKAIESISYLNKYDIFVFDDASTDPIKKYCKDNIIPFFGVDQPKGLTNLWNNAFRQFIKDDIYTHLILSNNDVIFSKDAIYNLGKCALIHNVDIIGPMSNKPGPIKEQIPTDYETRLSMDDDDLVEMTQNKISLLPQIHLNNWFKPSHKINGFCFMLSRNVKQIMNTVDCLFPPHLINVGNDDWLCQEAKLNNLKMGICTASFVYHYKAITTRLCKNGNRDNLYREVEENSKNQNHNVINRTKKIKPTILLTFDKAVGLGDGIMLTSTIVDLSKKYNIRIMCSESSYNIIKMYRNESIKVFNINQQGHFYVNDFYKSYNLVYWDTYNSLRQFPHQAINMIRKTAELPLFLKNTKKELPMINYDLNIKNKIKNFIDSLRKNINKPIVVVSPLMSYWNKMFDYTKLLLVMNRLKDKCTFIQLGGGNVRHMNFNNYINLIDNTSIEQTLGIIEYSDLVVCGDSFIQHAAGHLKTPAVVLFCGTSPIEFGYPYNSNIFHPEIAGCQLRCGSPQRWLYQYQYNDKNDWSSRQEMGWICPTKLCEKAISVDEIISSIEYQLSIGKERDWSFYDLSICDLK